MKSFTQKVEELTNLQSLNEMARCGWFGPKNKRTAFEVFVNTDDGGEIPHVHVRNYKKQGDSGDEFETCIKLSTARYFLHGHYTDTFNNSQLKDFDIFMKAPCKNKKYSSNYELAVDMWNMNNSKPKVRVKKDQEGNIIIPDYTKIKI